MTPIRKTITVLTAHNAWRRGGEGAQQSPVEIGSAIAHAIRVCEQASKLAAQSAKYGAAVAIDGMRDAVDNAGAKRAPDEK